MSVWLLILTIVLSSIVAEVITEHVTESELFLPVRKFVITWPFFGTLTTCPICFSQWASWLATFGFYRYLIDASISVESLLNIFLLGFAVMRLSSVVHDASRLLYKLSHSK